MPRLSKLIEKIEDRLANKWGCWYERNKARVPLYAVLGGIGWYLYGMFLNSLKLGKESVFNTTGEVIESIWVFNPFKNLFVVFTPFGLGVSAFIVLMVCLITKKGYSWFSGYKFTRDPRGFDILPDGTHGTSGFSTKKELAEHLELGSAHEVTGMLLGRIKDHPDDPDKYSTYVAHRMKPGENNNILCIGAPGSYKSRGFIIPFLMGCAQRSCRGLSQGGGDSAQAHLESVIATDPKGELFEMLAPYFREKGFYVKAVNFLDMAHSDGWNCLAGLDTNPNLVSTVANTIIQNTSGPNEADDFWSRAELNLLMALIHYVCNLKDARGNLLPIEQRSLGDVYKILAYKSVNEINRILAELPPEHPAKGPHGLFLKARENLWGNIIIGLGNRLAIFQDPLVDKITRNHDVDLYLEAIDVMLELTENTPIFYSQDRLLEPCLLRFGGDGEMLGLLFSVTWLDIPGRIAAAPRMKGERIIWITDCVDMGSINLPKHHFFAHRQQDGTHRFYGSSESERNQDQEVN